MKTAIIGGGIAGVSAAYELARRNVAFVLYESSGRLGGIVETVRRDGFVVECGPDSWVTEKPWARELAIEAGLESEIISSNDHARRTYITQGRSLVAMPDGMRMMVPTKWEPVMSSPLFSWQARLAYLREPKMAEALKAAVPESDESVADFVRRHFGDEVTETVAAPLLAGVFGGSIHTLSARAVMPVFVKMEREHGSLITALQKSSGGTAQMPVFTTLKSGLQSLIDSMAARLPDGSVRLHDAVSGIARSEGKWRVAARSGVEEFDAVVIAVPADVARWLMTPLDAAFDGLLDMDASSAIVVALAFGPEKAASLRIPRGFGFLVPQARAVKHRDEPSLLACTFVDQKFPNRAPDGSVLLRAFFGGESAVRLADCEDGEIVEAAQRQLSALLGQMPAPQFAIVRRWPRSLPQYAVGHLDRMHLLEEKARKLPGLHLIGNAYRGVGLPDLIRQGREVARAITTA